MQFISQYGLFLAETITLVIAILFTVAGLIAISAKEKGQSGLCIEPYNKKHLAVQALFNSELLDKKALKKQTKALKKATETTKKKHNLFVIHFVGDIKASSVDGLREMVTGLLSVATSDDEVVVTIDSGGGAVNSYGLAASQLQRIRDKGIPLTACVDKIAASGGYLMASVANTIIAAPFAYIGSIGVVAQLPNLHRWLKKRDIDIELLTAGEHKRTLTVLGENTAKGRKKLSEDLEAIHHIFKQHLTQCRPQLRMDDVATGEHWLAKDALKLQLVDRLQTSDDYITDKINERNIYTIRYKTKQTLAQKLFKPAARMWQHVLNHSHFQR